jgi:hypothetical protein
MPDSLGTRTSQNAFRSRPDQGTETRGHQQDVGMTKRKVTTATFTASNGRITGSASDFAAFALNDPILIEGTLLNNGFKTVTGLDGGSQAYLTLDPPPKDEGPVANTLVRTA